MRLVARRDPRLDPLLPPEQWASARRQYIILLLTGLVLLFGAVAAGGYYYTRSLDKTRGMEPEEVVEAAGMALAQADRYRFAARLTGESPDGFFPGAQVRGEYQREPLLLHLVGAAGAGEMKVPLEYYLEGKDLYVRNPRSSTWMVVRDANLEELYAFQPENLAAPLVTGLRSARAVGREAFPGGEALKLELEIDPKVMRIPAPGPDEKLTYWLWVDTRTLKPVRFVIDVVRTGRAEAAPRTSSFRYEISWEFGRFDPLAVPDEVKQQAASP